MRVREVNQKAKEIIVSIPITATSGKARVKRRSSIFEYGLPIAPRQKKFTQSDYVEWQIGYDVVCNDPERIALTTLPNVTFTANNTKLKALYELSEYLYYFSEWALIKKTDLLNIKSFLNNLSDNDLIENNVSCQIKRTHPKEIFINKISFYESKIEYPLLIHKFENYEIITEIVIKEKQRAVGTQAMLYFCFPLTELQANPILLGRTANQNELADFVFNSKNYTIVLEMVKIFGTLSSSHKYDILQIIEKCLVVAN